MSDVNTRRASLTSGEHVVADTLAFIAAGYDYQPQAFNNGGVENAAGQNEGSCKTLGLALLEGLSDDETRRSSSADGKRLHLANDRTVLSACRARAQDHLCD